VVERPQACAECAGALAGEQRYCLACGARIGSPSTRQQELMRRAGGGSRVTAAAAAGAPAAAATVLASPPEGSGMRLPSPQISALLVAVFLGFGIVLGGAAAGRVPTTLASSRSPLRVVLPSSGSSAPAGAGASSASSSEEPPVSEVEPTPAPTPAAAPSTTAAAPVAHSTAPAAESESTSGATPKPSAAAPATTLPPVKHVFVILLSNQPYADVFGPSSTAPYLSGTLEHKGELLVRYDAVAHEQLANEVALLSGQGPTAQTVANCPTYTDIAPTGIGADEQVLGSGCVYPSSTQTLAGELTAKHLTSRSYVQGIDEPGTSAGACAHPGLGEADPSADQTASSGPYATFRNPFVYFQSITTSPACAAADVGLAQLKGDLAKPSSTPSFALIMPDRCHDANPTPCTAGAPAGPAAAEPFLRSVVPEITGSKAFKESGLLVITVDEAPSSGEFADSSSCCGQPLYPNAPSRTPGGAPRGGGTVGALLLSPFVKGATTNEEPFNHFSLLRTIEDLFSVKHLGYAGLSAVKPFEPAMFTSAKG
jgi:phosphatidylinositol-3-phosphatase